VRFSAAAIANALGQPPPTPEQAAVIEATASSCLVVAGAGSGKTETMAGRVVWLVANDLVRPEQVLGLTFTRKAAAELAARVRRRLNQLAHHGLLDAELAASGEPTVSTYDAYAGRIVAEHALRLGREPGQRLIAQTVAWQFARRVVESYDGEMDAVLVQPRTVTADVLALAEDLAQHQVAAEDLQAYCEKLQGLLSGLPRGEKQRGTKALHADVEKVTGALAARCQLLPLVDAFNKAKRKAEVLDFADQMALAAQLADEFAEVAATERATYRAVLLDEYQDTSHAQLIFLRALFGSTHATAGAAPFVTAVGDPSQAIYGWRGASQGTLAAFPEQFLDGDRPASVLNLGTSFRNAARVLSVANHVAAPLRAGVVSTPVLGPRDDAPEGVVRCGLYPTIDDEAIAVADHVAAVWQADAELREHGTGARSIAVLVRAWRQLPRIEAALRARGIPLEIVGVGGLLMEPDVVDVVATLRVLADPSRGDALMRLLTGARWRIGPRDIAALGRWARQLMKTPAGQEVLLIGDEPDTEPETEPEPDDVDDSSIIDALDDLPPQGWLSHDGYVRLAMLASELRGLRGRLAQPLPELVADVVRTTGLDVEVRAYSGAGSRANLDRLIEVAAEFAEAGDSDHQVGLAAFLDYLDAAAVEERGLDRPDEEPTVPESRLGVEASAARVQLLTVHGSKGLEWDVVVVPGMVGNLFPGVRPADVRGWLTQRGALPWPMRGDRDGLPTTSIETSADQADAVTEIGRFSEAVKAHLVREERRLAYVAVTRAKSMLLCTGYRWDDIQKARDDSEFLVAVREACDDGAGVVDCWTPKPDDTDVNPLLAAGKTRLPWPYDPLGERRPDIETAAQLVSDMVEVDDPAIVAAMDEWNHDVEVLLAERAMREQRERLEVALPRQLSVSQLVTLRRDPAELALQLRRPMPMAPAPLARRGTAFHAWLEQRFSSPRLVDIDELPGSADPDAAPDSEFLALQQAFLASPWAKRDPVEVEVPFELVVGDTIVRGRIDAVFADPDGGFTVVDWKTGRRPAGADAHAAAVQLAAYRLAWADLSGVDVGRVRAAFCYLRDGGDYSPSDLLDREGLEQLLASVD